MQGTKDFFLNSFCRFVCCFLSAFPFSCYPKPLHSSTAAAFLPPEHELIRKSLHEPSSAPVPWASGHRINARSLSSGRTLTVNEGGSVDIPIRPFDEELAEGYFRDGKEHYCWDGTPCGESIRVDDGSVYNRKQGVPPEASGNRYAFNIGSKNETFGQPHTLKVQGTNVVDYVRTHQGNDVRSPHTLTQNMVDTLRESPGTLQPLNRLLGDRHWEQAILINAETGITPLSEALSSMESGSLLAVIDGQEGTIQLNEPIMPSDINFSMVGWNDSPDNTRCQSSVCPPSRPAISISHDLQGSAIQLNNCRYFDIENMDFSVNGTVPEDSGSQGLNNIITAQDSKGYVRQCRFQVPCGVTAIHGDGKSINVQEPEFIGCDNHLMVDNVCQINNAKVSCGNNQTCNTQTTGQPAAGKCPASTDENRGSLFCGSPPPETPLATGQKCSRIACTFGATVLCPINSGTTALPTTVSTAIPGILPGIYAITLGTCITLACGAAIDICRYFRGHKYTITGMLGRALGFKPPNQRRINLRRYSPGRVQESPMYLDPKYLVAESKGGD